MLMTVLKGTLATQQSKSLIRVFKTMRDYLADNAMVFRRLDRIELKQIEADEKFRQIFKQLEAPKQNTRFCDIRIYYVMVIASSFCQVLMWCKC